MQTATHKHSGSIALEHQGGLYTALYHVEGNTISVSTGIAVRSTTLTSAPIDSQARALLLAMIRAGEAESRQPH